jgi:TRAP-type C4-dicarboxylate transport system permease small subunit
VFGKALSWSEELTLLGFAWVVVISTVIGIRRMSHARMDLVIGLLPKALHRAADGLVAILMSVLGIFIAYAGWNYLIETRGATSAAVGFPIEFLYAAAPAFGVLIALFSLERLLPWAESLNE